MGRKAEEIDKALYAIMYNKMLDSGWDTIRSFTNGSKVPFSIETVRRVMSECDYKGISAHTVAIVAKYLGFTGNEIRDLLKTHTDDKDIWTLIGDHSENLLPDENSILEIYRAFKKESTDATNALVQQIVLLGNAYKVSLDPSTVGKLKR